MNPLKQAENIMIAILAAVVIGIASYFVLHDIIHPFGWGDVKGKLRAAEASAVVNGATVDAVAEGTKVLEGSVVRDQQIEQTRTVGVSRVKATITQDVHVGVATTSAFVSGLCDFSLYATDPTCVAMRKDHSR